jgi:hypothetical protein
VIEWDKRQPVKPTPSPTPTATVTPAPVPTTPAPVPPGPLPVTGFPFAQAGIAGLALLALGAGMSWVSRRQRRQS